MRGTTFKRGKTWSIVYDVGRDENGKRRQAWASGFATKAEAQAKLQEELLEVREGEHVDFTRATFRTFVDEAWLPHVRETRRASTVALYERALRLHIHPVIGGLALQKITPSHVDRLLRRCQQAKDGKPVLSAASARVLAAILSSAFAYAKRKRLVRANPVDQADLPTVQRRQGNIWTDKETGRFLESVVGDELEPLWRLYAVLGLRRGEGLGLRWQDLDLDTGSATIAQQLVPVDGRLIFTPPKTDAGRRTLPLDAHTVELLRAHRDGQRVTRELFGTDYQDADLVFCKPDGTPRDPRGISARFTTIYRAAKLPPIRLHDLRHGAAVLGIASGTHVELLRRQLGHASVHETIDRYGRHAIDAAQRAAVDSVAALVDGHER
jgi:integrase